MRVLRYLITAERWPTRTLSLVILAIALAVVGYRAWIFDPSFAKQWLVGVVGVAAFVGGAVAWLLHNYSEVAWGMTRDTSKPAPPRIPSGVTGFIERVVFAAFVASTENAASVVPLMAAWIGAKLAANWNRGEGDDRRHYAIRALLRGLVSMVFAYLGGSVAKGAARSLLGWL